MGVVLWILGFLFGWCVFWWIFGAIHNHRERVKSPDARLIPIIFAPLVPLAAVILWLSDKAEQRQSKRAKKDNTKKS